MERLIFHVDVNSAYLSWEAAKRVAQGGDDIRNIPSAIGGDREKRTGVILAKSIPAKKYNVKTGEPVAAALRKCPDLFLARPDFQLYERCSKNFIDICRKHAPIVEKYSIDECFLDMSGMKKLHSDPIGVAKKIKEDIKNDLGFTVNIGIGPNKILAKMASDFNKPDKIHTLFYEEIEQKLWPLPVRHLFGVGKATEERLRKIFVRTIGDLAGKDIEMIKAAVGAKVGKQIHDYANGIDESPVLREAEDAKGYSCSTTLDEDLISAEDAYKVLLILADTATSRMRSEKMKATCISVTIRSNEFKNHSHQRKLGEATDITAEVYRLSKELFNELWNKRTPLRLLGVALTGVTRGEELQQSFFRDENRERLRILDKTMDGLRHKYGDDKIAWGATLAAKEATKEKK